MKRGFFTAAAAFLCAAACAFGLVGCGHSHTFSEEWSHDTGYHWHAATCEHTDERSDYGAHTMATYVIMINVSSMVFMICFSISQATSIVTANAYGRKSADGILAATISGYVISLSVILSLIALIYHFPTQIFGIFTSDQSVMTVIKALIFYLLADVFIDALPLNIMGTLNGRSDVKIPTIFQIVSFLGVRISACYLLAFVYNLGLKGLILGLACGGFSSLVLNGGRYAYLRRRDKTEGLR